MPTKEKQRKEVPQQSTESIDWRFTEEDLEKIKDKQEKETGIFHWRNVDGTYTPITEMEKEDLEHAKSVCSKRVNTLYSKLQHHKTKHNNLLENLKAWAYREEQVEAALEELNEGLSKEAVEGTKELVEQE